MRGEQQMKSLNIPIPESLLLEPAATLHDLRREAQLVLALHYFDAGRLSCGQAASMAGLGKVAFLREASARGIPGLLSAGGRYSRGSGSYRTSARRRSAEAVG